jgi:hypothetical protein
LIDLAVEVQEIYSILAMKYFGTDLKKMKLEKQY